MLAATLAPVHQWNDKIGKLNPPVVLGFFIGNMENVIGSSRSWITASFCEIVLIRTTFPPA